MILYLFNKYDFRFLYNIMYYYKLNFYVYYYIYIDLQKKNEINKFLHNRNELLA